jgi:MtN3 and saliva related transmembrane protein
MQLVANLVGVGAALCSMGSFAPQALKILRERDASGVSARMYAITVIGFSLWSVYGALLHSWPLVGANVVCLALSGLILILKLKANGPEGAGKG